MRANKDALTDPVRISVNKEYVQYADKLGLAVENRSKKNGQHIKNKPSTNKGRDAIHKNNIYIHRLSFKIKTTNADNNDKKWYIHGDGTSVRGLKITKQNIQRSLHVALNIMN